MGEREYAAFRDDIQRRGILTPLEVTRAGVVIDGYHRWRAATELGHETVPTVIVKPREDLVSYMLGAALHRRSLKPSQKAALALEFDEYLQHREHGVQRSKANLRRGGGNTDVAVLPHRGRSRDRAAQLAGVSPRLIQHAITVRNNDTDLHTKVKAGEVPLERAVKLIERRANHARAGASPPLPAGVFDLIYADPPWQLGNPSSPWSPEQHYTTQPVAEISTLPIPAAESSVLFLWAVSSLLPQALTVISAWGFDYKTSLVWVKPSIGMGGLVRLRHEHLLVAIRGSYPLPDTDVRPDSVVEASRGRHYELIERMYPQARKLELYARGTPRTGWAAWGNEIAA